MNDNVMKEVCESVIMQAVEDYRELKRKGVEYINDRINGSYSIQELDAFFHSDWCNALLKANNIKYDGVTILRQLKNE